MHESLDAILSACFCAKKVMVNYLGNGNLKESYNNIRSLYQDK